MSGSCNKSTLPAVASAQWQHNERRNQRRLRWRALLLVAPLLLFILFNFVAPLGHMLYRSIHNDGIAQLIPETSAALSQWTDHRQLPMQAMPPLTRELQALAQNRQAGKVAAAVNRHYAGATSVINRTARGLRNAELPSTPQKAQEFLTQAAPQWAEPELWIAIHKASQNFTDSHYLTALDLERDAQGQLQVRQDRRIYLQLYTKTLGMAGLITLLCALLGYPLAYVLAHARPALRNLLLIFVLLPFWTSLLVRTAAWMALLQNSGVINRILLWSGLIDAPLTLLYTRFSTILAMTYILLPFMILPLFSVMRGINPAFMQAALSMGARPIQAFSKIYFPLSLPGLSAGALLVFIISIGYYITPALLGGTDGQMIANLIAFHMQESNNWGLAAALGGLLLIAILALYWIYERLVGMTSVRLY